MVSSADAKKAGSRNGNYQFEASVKVSKSANQDSEDEEDTSGLGDEDSENPLSLNPSSEDSILSGVDKVTFKFIAPILHSNSYYLPPPPAKENCSCSSF